MLQVPERHEIVRNFILRNLSEISESRGYLQVRHFWLREEGVNSPWYIPETSGEVWLSMVTRECGGRGLVTGERCDPASILEQSLWQP